MTEVFNSPVRLKLCSSKSHLIIHFFSFILIGSNGLVVKASGCGFKGPGFNPDLLQNIFLKLLSQNRLYKRQTFTQMKHIQGTMEMK